MVISDGRSGPNATGLGSHVSVWIHGGGGAAPGLRSIRRCRRRRAYGFHHRDGTDGECAVRVGDLVYGGAAISTELWGGDDASVGVQRQRELRRRSRAPLGGTLGWDYRNYLVYRDGPELPGR